MANFDVKCPDHYPMKGNLSLADKEYLETKEKYKAFFIFQYKDNDKYLEPVLEKFFNNRTWRLFNAGKETGSGTNFCNVCRYALASDFGIVSLSPLNNNVFQEIGLMIGLQKPLLYLRNPSLKPDEKLPFDVADKIYLEHRSKDELEQKLDKHIGFLIEKVELYSEYQKQFRESLQQKVNKLNSEELKILKDFLIESRPLTRGDSLRSKIIPLKDSGLIIDTLIEIGVKHSVNVAYVSAWEINPEYKEILREIVFKHKQ